MVANRSTFIESSINEVKKTALYGGLLAIMVLFLFLRNGKSTAIIAVSIPMSLLITFAPMHLAGVSLNIMSLGGLALGIGMLVDSSIVVLESIFRCKEEGDNTKGASIRGTKEVRGAVFASTLTSIAVFFPMVFVEGIAGQAFGDLGLAVVISLLASYIVAVAFIPMLASRTGIKFNQGFIENYRWMHYYSISSIKEDFNNTSGFIVIFLLIWILIRTIIWFPLENGAKLCLAIYAVWSFIISRLLVPGLTFCLKIAVIIPMKLAGQLLDIIQAGYKPLLNWSLNSSIAVFMIIFLCFGSIYYIGSQLDNELLPEVHQGEFTFEVQMPVGTPIEETYNLLNKVEQQLLLDKEDVKNILVTYGYDVTNTKNSDEGEHSAKFKILLLPNTNQAETEARVTERLRHYFESIPDATMRVERPVLFSATTPIVIEIPGDNIQLLKQKSKEARILLSALPELADVEASLRDGAPEIQVIYDRNKILQYGLNIGAVARQVRDMVKGNEATRFNKIDRRIPIIVQLDEKDRTSLESISNLTVNPGGEHPIPLYAIAELKRGRGPSEIRRIANRRVAIINANIAQGSPGNCS